MCNEIVKKMKMKRGYSDVVLLLRASGVNFECHGEELLEIAIMKRLEKPDISKEELITFVARNSSFDLSGDENDQKIKASYLMEEALQTVYTKHSEKLQSEGLVAKYINNVSDEIRIRELIRLRRALKKTDVDNDTEDIIVSIAMRMINKPDDSFQKILTWVSGKYDYDSEECLVKKIYGIKHKNISETQIPQLMEKLEQGINRMLLERKEIIF